MTRKFIIGLLLAFSAVTASAQNANATRCAKLGELAGSIMEARQSGVAFTKLMEVANGNSLVEAIVVESFKVPRFNTESNRQRAVTDFIEKVEVVCYSSVTSKGSV